MQAGGTSEGDAAVVMMASLPACIRRSVSQKRRGWLQRGQQIPAIDLKRYAASHTMPWVCLRAVRTNAKRIVPTKPTRQEGRFFSCLPGKTACIHDLCGTSGVAHKFWFTGFPGSLTPLNYLSRNLSSHVTSTVRYGLDNQDEIAGAAVLQYARGLQGRCAW
jgi:hypothetical protein